MTVPGLHVVLVHPEIPWNTGNVARTCLATGATLHLVRPLGFSLASKEVRRAGLDYWETLAPTVWSGWASFEAQAADLGELFLFSAEADCSLWETAFPPACVLVFGSESRGLPAELRRRYSHRLVRIPMAAGVVRSLNLSTSVAVALYEVLRQWGTMPTSPGPPGALALPAPGASGPSETPRTTASRRVGSRRPADR